MVRGTLGQQQMAKRFGDFPAFFAVLWGIGHKAGGEGAIACSSFWQK